MSAEWEKQILDQLDEYARMYDFPMPNNVYFHTADMRLTAFRSDEEWLIVFEQLAVLQEQFIVNAISAYGNKIERPGTQEHIEDIVEVPEPFSIPEEDAVSVGLELEPNMPIAARFLRWHAWSSPDSLFVPEERLLDACGRGNAELDLFLRLDEWRHPDTANDEKPSDLDCFRTLARAMATGDPRVYTCPDELANTDWRLWKRVD